MSARTRRLIVNWRSPATGAILPVAELLITEAPNTRYEFGYIGGVRRALEVGFHPFAAFPDVRLRYVGTALFPFFRNRVMPTTRPDYPEYLAALGLDGKHSEADVAEILGRGRGLRQTDQIETVLVPERDPETGRYLTRFLVRGVRRVLGAEEAAAHLRAGMQLRAELDPDNKVNPRARRLVSEHGVVGYVPDYLVAELDALEHAGAGPTFVVERVNPPPYPAHHRMLVRCEADWPEGFAPLDTPQFRRYDAESRVA